MPVSLVPAVCLSRELLRVANPILLSNPQHVRGMGTGLEVQLQAASHRRSDAATFNSLPL